MTSPSRTSRFTLGQKGFTLVELMMVVAVLGAILFAIVELIKPSVRYFQRGHMRQGGSIEMRSCMETLERVISTGKASTVQLSAIAGGNPTLSRLQFDSVDGASYVIATSNTPPNSVHLWRTPPGGGPTNDSILARNVGGLIFGWDPNDPSMMTVVLHMVVKLDSAGASDSHLDLIMPPQVIRMINS